MSIRLDNLRIVDPVLSTLTQVYSNNTYVGEKLFPLVKVNKTKGKIPVFGKDAFFIRDTKRALRANSNRIPTTDFELVDYQTKEYDVEMSIDYIEEKEANSSLQYQKHISRELSDMLLLNREKYIADLVQNVANYSSAMKKVISAGEAFDNEVSALKPITVINQGKQAIRAKIGKYPNTMIVGIKTYNTLINHSTIKSIANSEGQGQAGLTTLKRIFEIDDIFVGEAVYTENGTTFQDVWGDNVVLAYVDKTDRKKRSEYNPSFGYTFQLNGKPEIDVYYENGGKTKVIRNTDVFDIKISSSEMKTGFPLLSLCSLE